MKALTRALCLAFVMVGMLGVTGCGPDNEAEGLKASSKLGDPGKPAEGSGAAHRLDTVYKCRPCQEGAFGLYPHARQERSQAGCRQEMTERRYESRVSACRNRVWNCQFVS